MLLLTDLKTYLTASPSATGAVPFKLGDMPDTPDLCICAREYPGEEGLQRFGSAGLQIIKPRLQFEVRSAETDYLSADSLIQALYAKMNLITPQMTWASGWTYLVVVALGPPFPLGRDDKRRYSMVVNYRFEIHTV